MILTMILYELQRVLCYGDHYLISRILLFILDNNITSVTFTFLKINKLVMTFGITQVNVTKIRKS